MNYWLMKTEPEAYSWDDLKNQPNSTDFWDGVRNYQARNFMRDMKVGDKVFFYHSQINPPAIVGIATVVREAYPDPTQFDPESKYFDPKSKTEDPRWSVVDIRSEAEFAEPVTLPELRDIPELEEMVLLRKGSRLSVQSVTENEWKIITKNREIHQL